MKRIFALALLAGLTACKEAPTTAHIVRPAQVWTIGERQPGAGTTFSGEVKARFETDLSFRVGGKVMGRRVELGDTVAAGQVLAELDTTDLDLNLAAARANLRAAEADYDNARVELKRVAELRRKQFIGQSALDSAQAANDAAARVAAAKAQLELSGNQAGYTELKADHAGVITAVYAEAGQVVSAGTPVVHIAYEGEREVQIRVGEGTAHALAVGTAVSVRLWSQPDTELAGQVREVAPAADATRSFLVKVALPQPPATLRLGVTADVSLPGGATDATWLPATALFQLERRSAVWVVGEDNHVNLKTVEVVAFHGDGVTIAPLPAGTRVVAAGVHKLSNGQAVTPVPYDGKAGA